MTHAGRKLLAALALLLLACLAWLGWSAARAQGDLQHVRGALPAVRAALLAGDGSAPARLAAVQEDADEAYRRTHDPVWFVASNVTWLGQPLRTVRGLTAAVRGVASDGLPAVATVAASVTPAALRPEGDRVDLGRVEAAVGPLQTAALSLTREQERVRALSPSWLGPVAAARQTLLDQLDPLATSSRAAATSARLAPAMLGASGPRRYFLGLQNPAEARGTGGLLGAFAILVADQGRVRLEQLGSNQVLPPLPATVPGLDPTFVGRYRGQAGSLLWVNANVSPDFPEVGATWRAMWQAGTGQVLDGALALDPLALAEVLRGTGPVQAPGVGEVTDDSVVPLILRDQYRLTDVTLQRKDAMVTVGQAVVTALLGGQGDARALLDHLTTAGRDGHVLVESSHPEEQAALAGSAVGGQVSRTAAPFAEAVVVNATGGKLDAYLDSSLRYRVTSCDRTGRDVTVTTTLRNTAPTSGLPAYVTIRDDLPQPPVPPGQNRSDLRVLTTIGTTVRSATLDGRPLLIPSLLAEGQPPDGDATDVLDVGAEGGRPALGLVLELPSGVDRTLVLTLREPPSTQSPLLPHQAMARPPSASADVSACTRG